MAEGSGLIPVSESFCVRECLGLTSNEWNGRIPANLYEHLSPPQCAPCQLAADASGQAIILPMTARWLPKRMTPIHAKAARLLVVGMHVGDVAVAVGVYPTTVSHWRRAPGFIALIEQYQREALRALCAAFARRLAEGSRVGSRRATRAVSPRSLANLKRGSRPGYTRRPTPHALDDEAPIRAPTAALPPEAVKVLRQLNATSGIAASR